MVRGAVRSVGGTPLGGVAVSDGEAVAVTDGDGRYELPGGATPFVWVHRGTGWDAERWFARLDGLTQDTDAEVDFQLTPVDQPVPFTFAQLTDLHVSAVPEPAALPLPDGVYGVDGEGKVVDRPLTRPDDLVHAIHEVLAGADGPVRFAVATGDLTDHGTASEFALLQEALGRAPLPVHVLPGNHDHYGHDHEPDPGDAPVDSHGMGAGTTHRYERHVGPRWWSLTHGGLRLVALDWFSHRLGLDADRQERWLAADLAVAPPGTPVLLLTHDQMGRELFERAVAAAPHVRLVGSLTGHWHTSRVVRVDGQLHVNTGNATFGSFDWAPAHGRLYRWDGDDLEIRSVTVRGGERLRGATFVGRAEPHPVAGATWSVALPGTAHLGAPALVDGPGDPTAVVPWSDDDRAAGGVVAHDVATGALRWAAALGAPVRAGVTVAPDGATVVAVTVNGGVAVLDAATGALRWRRQVGDPLRMWVHAAPVVADGLVVVGEVRTYAALDLADGSVRWSRDDLGRPENYLNASTGVVVDGVLVTAFPFDERRHTVGLDLATGADVWVGDDVRLRSPTTPFVLDPADGQVVVGRLGSRVDKLDPTTGAVRWKARLGAAFCSGRPVVVDGAVFVTTGRGTVHRLDAATGAEMWRVELPGDALLAMGPYRRAGQATPAGPALGAPGLYQGAGDGRVHRLDPATGAATVIADVGAPVTVPPLVADRADGGSDVLVATTDGWLHRLPG